MTDILDEEEIERKKKRDDSGEGDQESSGRGKAGSGSGGVGFSVADDLDEESVERKKKRGDSGEGDSDSFGRGKAGSGAGVSKLPPHKLKEVMADWRHFDVAAVVEAVAEFFTEMPMRASANLSVKWERTKSNVKSFALVNWVLEFGDKTIRELAKTRERVRGAGRDTRGFQRRRPGIGMAPKLGPAGPTGPTGQ